MIALDVLAEGWPWTPGKQIDKTSDQSAQGKAFHDKVRQIAARLGVNPSDLIRIMHFETNGEMKASTPGPGGCVGLIQFCPIAQQSLNITGQALAQMTEVEQLDYVEKFFKFWKLPRGADLGTLYMAVLLPIGLNKPNNFVLGVEGDTTLLGSRITRGDVYRDNPSFRVKGKRYFTVGDVRDKIHSTKFY